MKCVTETTNFDKKLKKFVRLLEVKSVDMVTISIDSFIIIVL